MPSRIPPDDSSFNTYITTTGTALGQGTPTTAVRLGLDAGENTQWQTFKTDWVNVYAQFSDTDLRTKSIKDEKNRIKQEFTDFANPLLTRMSVSPNITSGDRNTFKLPARKDASSRPDIGDKPLVGLVAKGGGTVQVVVRLENDGSKASMHPDADLIELRHVLQTVDSVPPASVRELTEMTIASRGRSELKLGDYAIGRVLYLVARYVNKVDAAKNGPWSTMQRQVVA